MAAKTYPDKNDIQLNLNGMKVCAFQSGIRNTEVIKAITGVVELNVWTTLSSLVLESVKECAVVLGGTSAAGLVKELFLVGQTSAGTVVAYSMEEVFKARITKLEQRKRPVFTWCQPEAMLLSHSTIEHRKATCVKILRHTRKLRLPMICSTLRVTKRLDIAPLLLQARGTREKITDCRNGLNEGTFIAVPSKPFTKSQVTPKPFGLSQISSPNFLISWREQLQATIGGRRSRT